MSGTPSRVATDEFRGRWNEPSVVSYAQNAEDVRLWRVFGAKRNGFYVDVGAGDPVVHSVTKLFYDAGWSGINIEPGPQYAELVSRRPRDINIQRAVASREGETDFWISSPDSGLSGFERPPDRLVPEGFTFASARVRCSRLDALIGEHGRGRAIDFLKVDVEGAETDVLRSLELDEIRPTVILVEAISPLENRQNHETWESLILEREYVFAVFDGINRFYVAAERDDLLEPLAYPMSVLDRYEDAAAVGVRQELERSRSEMEAQLEAARASLGRLRHDARDFEQRAAEATREAASADQRSELVERRIAALERELATVYASHTWRAGRLVARVGRPVARPLRGVRRIRRHLERPLGAVEAYAQATQPGEPWYFPADATTPVPDAGRLLPIVESFAELPVPLEPETADTIRSTLHSSGWASDARLLARELSWEERQAIVEVFAALELATLDREEAAGPRRAGRGHVVVDVRSLQDPLLATRGVGIHGLEAIRVLRSLLSGKRELVGLVSAAQPDLSEVVSREFDMVEVPSGDVRSGASAFLQLSPMTASCAPCVDYLLDPLCVTASLVYDFIPTRYPAAYLPDHAGVLENRARLEALRRYDVLLPISHSTLDDALQILGTTLEAHVTYVADPLPRPRGRVIAREPFVLVPGGGDPRKNLAAAVAALAQTRGVASHLKILTSGSLTETQSAALRAVAAAAGLHADAVQARGYVTSEDLADLNASATAIVVPSHAEGFSIPVVEAVQRGTPVVASDIPAHRELLGDGPWLAPAHDVVALARALTTVLGNRDAVVARQQAHLGDKAAPAAVRRRMTEGLERLVASSRPTRRAPRRGGSARPRIAVLAPTPPQISGVADFTAFTFAHVARHADVQVFTSGSGVPSQVSQPRPVSPEPFLRSRYDRVVSVAGNSHYHLPILDVLSTYGGPCIAHDDRMVEAYHFDRGVEWTASLMSSNGGSVDPADLPGFIDDLDSLPSAGYELLARIATPLIVHSASLRERIHGETGVRPELVRFVPYNRPAGSVDQRLVESARRKLGLDEEVLHVGTFGGVDRRTKRTDVILGALAWWRDWGQRTHLHVIGGLPTAEDEWLSKLIDDLGLAGSVTVTGHVSRDDLERYLLGVDAAVQLRSSGRLTLSGALADCIAFGVPTVTTNELAEEHEAPGYVRAVAPDASSIQIAEALEPLVELRRSDLAATERDRVAYLEARSGDRYAADLLGALGLAR